MKAIKIAAFWMGSFTWGIIMTLIGAVGALAFIIIGARPMRIGYSWAFVVGQGWGAVTLGPFVWMSEGSAQLQGMRLHEAGHSIQNCVWGMLFPFVVMIPSLISVAVSTESAHRERWFERQATDFGYRYCNF